MARIEHTPKLWETVADDVKTFMVWCPACKCGHTFPCGDGTKRPNWNFNGNVDRPSFTPSLRLFIPAAHSFSKTDETVCHLVLTDGVIEYCGDCPHELKGQKVPMVDIPPEYGFG